MGGGSAPGLSVDRKLGSGAGDSPLPGGPPRPCEPEAGCTGSASEPACDESSRPWAPPHKSTRPDSRSQAALPTDSSAHVIRSQALAIGSCRNSCAVEASQVADKKLYSRRRFTYHAVRLHRWLANSAAPIRGVTDGHVVWPGRWRQLRTDNDVSPSTQNQAASALPFLYREVLHTELEIPPDVIRPRKPRRLPAVMTRAETLAIIQELSGTYRQIAALLYGAGHRLMESRLPVRDSGLRPPRFRGVQVVRLSGPATHPEATTTRSSA